MRGLSSVLRAAAASPALARGKLEISWLLLLLICCLLALGLITYHFWLRKRVEERLEQDLAEILRRHASELELSTRQMRSWRHDLKNHFQVLRAYAELGENDELLDYLDHLAGDLAALSPGQRSQHLLVDALLNAKIHYAQEQGIEVQADVLLPPEIPLPDLDLCILIGNLFDNAVESAAAVPEGEERLIRLYIRELKSQLYLYIANTYTGERRLLGQIFPSSKASGEHGFGLLRIDRVVSRHRGYLKRAADRGLFATEVFLPYP